MIEPNFRVMWWMFLIIIFIEGIARILMGATGAEKETKYGATDILSGVIYIIIFIVTIGV